MRERTAPSRSEFTRQGFLGVWTEEGETVWVPGIGMREGKRTSGKKRNIRSLCACFIYYNSFWFY